MSPFARCRRPARPASRRSPAGHVLRPGRTPRRASARSGSAAEQVPAPRVEAIRHSRVLSVQPPNAPTRTTRCILGRSLRTAENGGKARICAPPVSFGAASAANAARTPHCRDWLAVSWLSQITANLWLHWQERNIHAVAPAARLHSPKIAGFLGSLDGRAAMRRPLTAPPRFCKELQKAAKAAERSGPMRPISSDGGWLRMRRCAPAAPGARRRKPISTGRRRTRSSISCCPTGSRMAIPPTTAAGSTASGCSTGFDPAAQGLLSWRRPQGADRAARLHRRPRRDRDLARADLQEQAGAGPAGPRIRRLSRLLDHRLHRRRSAFRHPRGSQGAWSTPRTRGG